MLAGEGSWHLIQGTLFPPLLRSPMWNHAPKKIIWRIRGPGMASPSVVSWTMEVMVQIGAQDSQRLGMKA